MSNLLCFNSPLLFYFSIDHHLYKRLKKLPSNLMPVLRHNQMEEHVCPFFANSSSAVHVLLFLPSEM